MDCCNLLCTNKAIENKVCRKCYMRIYCSDGCRTADWNILHRKQCKTQILTLKDFTPVAEHKALGKGTYGEVQLIKHRSTGQFFALKEIKKQTKERKVPIKMLFREISIQKKLIHPNIIRLVDHCETTETVYLFLEYADGGNLYAHLRKKLRLPEREAYHYFSQICQGVKYLHDSSIIHRDLKPDNILLTKAGTVKICDFGWCASSENDRSTYCGTLDYMAPEILFGGNYNNKIDVWSLGVILFEMLQSQTPFKGKNNSLKLQCIKKGELEFTSNISNAAKDLVRRMLNGEPEQRLSIDEVLNSEWVSRYSGGDSEVGLLLPRASVDSELKDEVELKLSKNYPSSFKRATGFSSNFLSPQYKKHITSVESSFKSDSNSNNPVNESELPYHSPSIISQHQQELEKLQKTLESAPKKRSLFSKILGSIGLS